MADSSNALPESVVDVRTVRRNIAKGVVSRKGYEKYLASLPDRAPAAEAIQLEDSEDGAAERTLPE